jgi:YegS/Rv2252/BmrU family lipid kinase
MSQGPERVILEEPEILRGFFGRKYLPPPEKVPHFRNRRVDVIYETQRAHVIVNPFSGRKKGNEVGDFVLKELSDAKIKVELYKTGGPEHAISIVNDLSLVSNDIIVSVGGDGTLCEIITGLMLRSDSACERIPVALIPAGSGNSQANDMEIMDYMNAVERIFNGRLRKMDIGKVTFMSDDKQEIRYSHNLVGWGLGVDSNLLAEKMRFLGPLRYDIGAFMSIIRGRVRKARCYIDGHLLDSAFVLLLIQNTKTGGDRLTLAPMAQVDDGKMDLGVIYHIGRLKVLKMFNQLKSEGSHVWNPNVEFYRFTKLRIETDGPTPINIDGENLGFTPIDIEVLPSVISMFH